MASIYEEKAEKLNAENLERVKIERIARMLVRKQEEILRHEANLKDIDTEIKRLEEATLIAFNNECCETNSTCMPRGARF
jgi:hypothetical protein